MELAGAAFSSPLDILAQVPGPRRAEGGLYKLPHALLFSILADVDGCNSYRGIVTFVDVYRQRLNAVFALQWRRAPAHTAIRYRLQGLDPAAVEAASRRHAGLLQAARRPHRVGTIALDGEILRGSFDRFPDRTAAGVLSAFASTGGKTACLQAGAARARTSVGSGGTAIASGTASLFRAP